MNFMCNFVISTVGLMIYHCPTDTQRNNDVVKTLLLRRVPAGWGPFYQLGLTIIPSWISNHMPSKVWDEITYPFPNFNGCTVEVWKWISNFIPHFMMDVIT